MKNGHFLRPGDIRPDRVLLAAPSDNTVTEVESIKACLDERRIAPRHIAVVCSEMHARSVRLIFKKLFPESRVSVVTYDYLDEIDPSGPDPLSRSFALLVASHLARHIVLRVCGLRVTKLFKRPMSAGPRSS